MSEEVTIAEVGTKRNPTDMQLCGDEPAQRDKNYCLESHLICHDNNHDNKHFERINLTEEDIKDDYFYHHDVDNAYNEEGPPASNKCSDDEGNCQNSNKNQNIKYNKDILSDDYDKTYPHQHNSQQNSSDNNSYCEAQDQAEFFEYSEEHAYQKKHREKPNRETCSEMSYIYHTANETVSQMDELSTYKNESQVTYSKGQSFIQIENTPVECQESCSERENEYLKDDAYENKLTYSDTREVCVVKECVYSGYGNVLQEGSYFNINQDPCRDRYCNYELPNENVYHDVITFPEVQHISKEQNLSYQPGDESVYNRKEPTTIEQDNCQERSHCYEQDLTYQSGDDSVYNVKEQTSIEHDNCQERSHFYEQHLTYQSGDDSVYNGKEQTSIEQERSHFYEQETINSENVTYIVNKAAYQERVFLEEDDRRETTKSIEEENGCIREDADTFKREEASAVDLRILRPLNYPITSEELPSTYNNMQESIIISQVPVGFCVTDHPAEKASPTYTEHIKDNIGYESADQTHYKEEYKDPGQHIRNAESFDCGSSEAMYTENHNFWNAATNTDPKKVLDKGSQTKLVEKRDIAVQTVNALPFAFLKNIQDKIVKHKCPICQRVYISKSSFDRHLRTHEKEKSNFIANVRFTTEAKLQICKRVGKNRHLKAHKPIIIHVPRSIFRCDMCEKVFPNQREQDNHDCTFKPFPLTKCPECHIKFYTTGALNQHIGIVHKKDTVYYCIFCNKSFNAGYNFHLHLDEHLSTQ